MRSTLFQIQGTSRVERHQMVDSVEEAIRGAGGWILDYHQFSNISLVLEIEILGHRLPELTRRLEEAGVVLLAPVDWSAFGDEPLTGTLQITFIHSEPDLRIKTPAVPG